MATVPDLVSAADLAGFKGAPFPEARIKAAAQAIRGTCGWHIAPNIETTWLLNIADRATEIRLPSKLVTSVISVNDLTSSTPRPITDFRWSQDGRLSRPGGFPLGLAALEVTVTHGYETCPEDLKPMVIAGIQRKVLQESIGARSVTYAEEGYDDGLAPYRLGPEA